MEITDVRVRRTVATETKIRATASVVVSGCFVVHDFRVIEGVNGLFVSMPCRRNADGSFRDIAHPITAEFRLRLLQSFLAANPASPWDAAGYKIPAGAGPGRVRTRPHAWHRRRSTREAVDH